MLLSPAIPDSARPNQTSGNISLCRTVSWLDCSLSSSHSNFQLVGSSEFDRNLTPSHHRNTVAWYLYLLSWYQERRQGTGIERQLILYKINKPVSYIFTIIWLTQILSHNPSVFVWPRFIIQCFFFRANYLQAGVSPWRWSQSFSLFRWCLLNWRWTELLTVNMNDTRLDLCLMFPVPDKE